MAEKPPISPDELRFFDPKDDYAVEYRHGLPHWSQPGALCFITWRTYDSMPVHVLERWLQERNNLLTENGLDPLGDWRSQLGKLPVATRRRVQWSLFERWDAGLDEAHGACRLRESELSKIVADSLLHFDGDRYLLTDFVVMPNHVHLIGAFPSEAAMKEQCQNWKQYTARQINKAIGQSGSFWRKGEFDHLIRNEDSFRHYREYLVQNPVKARLGETEFRAYLREL